MNIVLFGKGGRGEACLAMLRRTGRHVSLVVGQPQESIDGPSALMRTAQALGLPTAEPDDPNGAPFGAALAALAPDLMVLAGYGRILYEQTFSVSRVMCINLHGGKLPNYRGSSPLNWALINGEPSFTLSIIRVDAGIDTGDIIEERTFDIGANDTIRDLHAIAEDQFPRMLDEVLAQIESGDCRPRPQPREGASYWPRRFPEDGFIVWDMLTAAAVHNRVRALTDPYPGARTAFRGRAVRIAASSIADPPVFGEPGRVYRSSGGRLLVCAADRCLWLGGAVFLDTGAPLADEIQRYDCLPTMRQWVRHASESESWSLVP